MAEWCFVLDGLRLASYVEPKPYHAAESVRRGDEQMTRIFNDPADFKDEMTSGFVSAYARYVEKVPSAPQTPGPPRWRSFSPPPPG
jgi:hypothetical protein